MIYFLIAIEVAHSHHSSIMMGNLETSDRQDPQVWSPGSRAEATVPWPHLLACPCSGLLCTLLEFVFFCAAFPDLSQ